MKRRFLITPAIAILGLSLQGCAQQKAPSNTDDAPGRGPSDTKKLVGPGDPQSEDGAAKKPTGSWNGASGNPEGGVQPQSPAAGNTAGGSPADPK